MGNLLSTDVQRETSKEAHGSRIWDEDKGKSPRSISHVAPECLDSWDSSLGSPSHMYERCSERQRPRGPSLRYDKLLYFFEVFFLCMDHCKVFIEFVTMVLPFYVCLCFSGGEACGVLALGPGIRLSLLALGSKV